jgi:ureidoacrylate peracid hydrolase
MEALFIVDLQRDFCDPALTGRAPAGSDELADRIEKLAVAARRAGRPVVWIRTVHDPATDTPRWLARHPGAETICRPGTPGADFYRIGPSDSDTVFTKHRYSAFYGTDLERSLIELGIDEIVCCGLMTNVCVDCTIRDAMQRDFSVAVVADACLAEEPALHEAALANIQRHFGRLTTCEELAERWSGDRREGTSQTPRTRQSA